MEPMYYIGLDVHKRIIRYCVKDGSGTIYAEGTIPATRFDLDHWMKTLPQPWTAARTSQPMRRSITSVCSSYIKRESPTGSRWVCDRRRYTESPTHP